MHSSIYGPYLRGIDQQQPGQLNMPQYDPSQIPAAQGFNPQNMPQMNGQAFSPQNMTPGGIDAAANYKPGQVQNIQPVNPQMADASQVPGLLGGGANWAGAAAGLAGLIAQKEGEGQQQAMPLTPAPTSPGVYRPFNLWG